MVGMHHIACKLNNLDIILLLLKHGANHKYYLDIDLS
jgi:hypothetical protein